MKKNIKKVVVAAVVIAVIAVAWVLLKNKFVKAENKVVFQYETLDKTDVVRTISATGTVEPEELINVGAQVNGRIMKFGTDIDGKTVDYGSKVRKGDVLALIDDVIYKSELQQAQASRAQAEAAILNAEATIKECAAKEILAKNEWERAKSLSEKKIMSGSESDSAKATYFASVAQSAKAQASLAQAKAQLANAEAVLVKAERNLEYCSIVSPVDGIIIDRRVSIGQTVVSNQTASSMFLVAKDFKKMQVWVSVNEADIGAIKPGMAVRFSCDAFPKETFEGTVHRIRLNATLSSNVVTYIVEVNAPNDNMRLLPYLTANVKFIRGERKNVLAVSNAILRFQPPAQYIDKSVQIPEVKPYREALLYVERTKGKLTPVKVRIGMNNGALAEIITEELKEGDKIVSRIDVVSAHGAAQSDLKNPFLPSRPARNRNNNRPNK